MNLFTRKHPITRRERITGSMFGLAYGDSMGKATEFMFYAPMVVGGKAWSRSILEVYGWKGPKDIDARGRVTDDTQMALCVSAAINADEDFHVILPKLFRYWLRSMGPGRAPGRGCVTAISRAYTRPWWEATGYDNKGCGANMRVTPLGLKGGLSLDEMANWAQWQAAITHAHPTALVAAELTAYAVRLLVEGTPLVSLPRLLLARCEEQRYNYRGATLGGLWEWCNYESPEDYISLGWDECESALYDVTNALRNPRPKVDPCIATGGGWIAEECLATALHCALLFPNDPVKAIRRAAATSGDSDSIAAITGALVGAAHGMDAWPQGWAVRIEYRRMLTEQSAKLSAPGQSDPCPVCEGAGQVDGFRCEDCGASGRVPAGSRG